MAVGVDLMEQGPDGAPLPGASPPQGPPGGSTSGGASTLRRNLASLATSQVITWVLALVWTLVVPRTLGPADMGLMVIALSLTSLVAVAFSFLTRDFLVREMVREPDGARRLISNALLTRLFVVPLLFLASFLYGSVAGLDGRAMTVMYLMAGAAACLMLMEPALAGFQATERMQYIAFADVGNKSLNTLGAVLLALGGLGVVAIASFTLAVALGVLLATLFWLHRMLPLGVRPANVASAMRRGRSYWFVGVFYVGYLWADGFMLGVMAPEEVVGWYGAATRLFTTMMFVATIVATASLPRMVAAHAHSDDQLYAVARQPFEWVAIMGLPIGVGLASIAGGLVPLLYGQEYIESVVPLALLGLAIPFMYVNIIVAQVCIAAGRPRVIGWLLAATSLVNIVANLALIPFTQDHWGNGAIGAAAGLLLAEVAQMTLGLVLVGRRLLTISTMARICGASLAAAGMALAIWLAQDVPLIVQIPLGAVVFLALIVVLKVPTPPERAFVVATLRRLARLPVRPARRRS